MLSSLSIVKNLLVASLVTCMSLIKASPCFFAVIFFSIKQILGFELNKFSIRKIIGERGIPNDSNNLFPDICQGILTISHSKNMPRFNVEFHWFNTYIVTFQPLPLPKLRDPLHPDSYRERGEADSSNWKNIDGVR